MTLLLLGWLLTTPITVDPAQDPATCSEFFVHYGPGNPYRYLVYISDCPYVFENLERDA